MNSRRSRTDPKKSLEAYQLFVAALVRSIDRIHDVAVQAQLRVVATQARVAQGLPPSPSEVERTMESFIATVDEYVEDGGDVEYLKMVLRQRAHIRGNEQ